MNTFSTASAPSKIQMKVYNGCMCKALRVVTGVVLLAGKALANDPISESQKYLRSIWNPERTPGISVAVHNTVVL